MEIWRKAIIGAVGLFAVAGLAVGGYALTTAPTLKPGQMALRAQKPFTQGAYFAYVQPWGGRASFLTSWWAPHADTLALDLKQFPNNSDAYWRWPPFTPRNGPGVWSYQAVMYGNYDGGEPEEEVPPVRVRDLKAYSQDFEWSIDTANGDANVLTEFYLRSKPDDPDAKVLEVGFFLHMPPQSRKFFEEAKDVGTWTDPQGRAWHVRLDDTFCMFAPVTPTDIRKGTLDMHAAVQWLAERKVINPDNWVGGVSIGAEAVHGRGKLHIAKWSARQS